MSETLWIWLAAGVESGAPLAWARVDGTGRVTARGVDGVEGLPVGLTRKAVLATDRLLWSRLALPGGRPLRGAALVYALEDRLVEEPEAVHAVAGRTAADGSAMVAAVGRGWLAAVLQALAPAGQPTCILPEPALVPATDRVWVVLWTGQPCLLSDGGAVRLEPDQAAALRLLAVALSTGPLPERLELRVEPGRARPDAEAWARALGIPVSQGDDYDWAVAAQQAVSGRGMDAPDLAGGELAAGPRWRLDRGAWRPAAWLAVALLAVNGLGYLAGHGVRTWDAQRLREANRAQFLVAFPDAKVVVDPVLQMRRKLVELRHAAGEAAATDFLALLARAGQVLPTAARSGVQEMRYEDGRLTLLVPTGVVAPGAWAVAGLHAEPDSTAAAGVTAWRIEVAR